MTFVILIGIGILIAIAIGIKFLFSKRSEVLSQIQNKLKILEPNLPFEVKENVLTNTTFTLNKRVIYLCTKTKDINTLMYVAIHELAHIKTEEYGHTPNFVNTFKKLLKRAEALGIWENVNYSKNPQIYCNGIVNDDLSFL